MLSRLLPVTEWAPRYQRHDLANDLFAGLVIAVLLVPQGLAYASLAGMPPITGLYTAVGALVLYALLGTSPYISPGPTAVTALLVAHAVQTAAGQGAATGDYVTVAAVLAVLVGLVRLALGFARAGTFMNLVSQPVLTAFTAAAGVLIILSQAGDFLGLEVERAGDAITAVGNILPALDGISVLTAVIGAVCLAALLLGGRLPDLFPGPLVVVAVASFVVWAFNLEAHGVAIIGDVPAGLPAPSLPWAGGGLVGELATSAIVIGLIGYIEGVSIARTIALRKRERLDLSQEFVALGAASVGAGLLGGFPNGGSFSRTALSQRVGARTQLAGLSAAAALAVSLAVLTPLFRYIPQVVLAAIVIYATTGLFDVETAREAFGLRRRDGAALVVTFVATLALGVQAGFLIGASLNIVLYLYRVTRPPIGQLGRVRGTGTFRNVERWDVETTPTVYVLRVDAPLIFLSVEAFTDRVNKVLAEEPDVVGFVLDASPITDIDATGVHALHTLIEQAEEGGWDLRFATIRGPVRDRIRRAGMWDYFAERAYPDITDAIASLEEPEERLLKPHPEEQAPDQVL